jgi:hypothetical protein
MENLVALGDLHCGSQFGLTPPEWRSDGRIGKKQAVCWDFFTSEIDKIGQIDNLLVNGDVIEGRNDKSGGLELLPDLGNLGQLDIAQACIEYVKAKNVYITLGTGYHVDAKERFEKRLSKDLNKSNGCSSNYQITQYFKIEDVSFYARHKIGSSSVPHGRFNSLAKEREWHVIKAYEKFESAPDVCIYSHVHYFVDEGGISRGKKYKMMILPCLQDRGGTYGESQCSGIVNYGFISFKIKGDKVTWKPHILF